MNRIEAAEALSSAAEASIVALAKLGDRAAFTELVRRRQSQIRNLLRRLCRDPTLADDLAQDVFLKAFDRLSHLRAAGAFGGWLRQIAVNAWLQQARDREDFSEPLAEEFASPATNESIGQRMDLDAALDALPAQVRMCIVLSYQEGMSHGEVAQLTEMPIGTVKSHISRGTRRLRTLLQAYDSDHERSAHEKRSQAI